MSPRQRVDIAAAMVKEYAVSVRNACRSVRLPRACSYTPAPRRDETEVIARIEEYIRENPRHGFDKMYATLQAQAAARVACIASTGSSGST